MPIISLVMSTSAVRVRPQLSPTHTPPLWNAAAAYRVGRVKRVCLLYPPELFREAAEWVLNACLVLYENRA